MWEVLVGSMAANKAASIGVGLSVLLGAAGTAEVTGVGPAVREIVRAEATQTDQQDADESGEAAELVVETIEEDALEATTEELNVEEETEDADPPQDDREHFSVADEDAPGNLTWHLRGGAFMLRGVLVEGDHGLAVRTAGPDGDTVDLPVDPALVTARIPGENGRGAQADSETTIEDYVGYLVRASGNCTESDDTDATECTVEELHVLGEAGQNGDDEEAETSETLALESESDDDSDEGDSDEGDSDEDEDEDDEGHGKPEHAGPKHDRSESD
jgi:hypothetical protein